MNGEAYLFKKSIEGWALMENLRLYGSWLESDLDIYKRLAPDALETRVLERNLNQFYNFSPN